jgi:hypothetical protein
VNERENAAYQDLWDIAKAELRGKFIAWSAYISKEGKWGKAWWHTHAIPASQE